MTTPQNELYRLSERINHLTDLFESDEDGINIFDSISDIKLHIQEMISGQIRQENLMNLIIKLLSKE